MSLDTVRLAETENDFFAMAGLQPTRVSEIVARIIDARREIKSSLQPFHDNEFNL